MPVRPIHKKGKDGVLRLVGYQWGHHGKIYLIRSFGKKGAMLKAHNQGAAAFANGYKGS